MAWVAVVLAESALAEARPMVLKVVDWVYEAGVAWVAVGLAVSALAEARPLVLEVVD